MRLAPSSRDPKGSEDTAALLQLTRMITCSTMIVMRILLIAGAAAALAACAKEQVLFVCEHGAAKSVVAAAYFNKLASERGLRARAIARGAAPQDALAKSALAGLQGDGLAPGLEAPQAVTEADVHGSARVVPFD